MGKRLIELVDVSKDYEGDLALEHVNLYINDGEFLTLLGPSGCGKTTTLRLIAGFIMPSSGHIYMNGTDIAQVPPYKREINTVFQKYALFPHLNVFDNIAFGLRIKKTPKDVIEGKVHEMLKLVNLEGYGKRWVDQLSGGQQQRVAIARALVNQPKILLLDEPLGALDLKLRQEMQVELKRMQQALGITFVYVTHDQTEALTMSDTIVIMKDGVIQQIGRPKDIYNEPKNVFVADFIGESNIIASIMPEDYKVRMNGVTYTCVDAGFGKNVEVDAVVRPEDIDIVPIETGMVKGTVTSVVFMGVHYEVCVDCGGYEWVVHTTEETTVGAKVGIEIPPDAIHIMKKTRSNNIFDCEVYPGDGEIWIDDKAFACTIPEDYENKEVALVQIQPKDVQIVNPQDAKLTGFVKACMFLGSHYEITVSCEENDWIAYTPDFMEDGEEVGIRVEPEKLVLSHKTEGSSHEAESIFLSVHCMDGTLYTGSHVVCALLCVHSRREFFSGSRPCSAGKRNVSDQPVGFLKDRLCHHHYLSGAGISGSLYPFHHEKGCSSVDQRVLYRAHVDERAAAHLCLAKHTGRFYSGPVPYRFPAE